MTQLTPTEKPTYPLFRECIECTLHHAPCTELRDAALVYLPTPWQGEACADTKVLFLSVNPSPSVAPRRRSGGAMA